MSLSSFISGFFNSTTATSGSGSATAPTPALEGPKDVAKHDVFAEDDGYVDPEQLRPPIIYVRAPV